MDRGTAVPASISVSVSVPVGSMRAWKPRWPDRHPGRPRSRPSTGPREHRRVGRRASGVGRAKVRPRRASRGSARRCARAPSRRRRLAPRGAHPRVPGAGRRRATTRTTSGPVRSLRRHRGRDARIGRPDVGPSRTRRSPPSERAGARRPASRTSRARPSCRDSATLSAKASSTTGNRSSASAAPIHRCAFRAEIPYRIDDQWARSRAPVWRQISISPVRLISRRNLRCAPATSAFAASSPSMSTSVSASNMGSTLRSSALAVCDRRHVDAEVMETVGTGMCRPYRRRPARWGLRAVLAQADDPTRRPRSLAPRRGPRAAGRDLHGSAGATTPDPPRAGCRSGRSSGTAA